MTNHLRPPQPRLLAFYLPQFHPIPENDVWWGSGFTEWTNVTRARPLFPGHYQPHLPADLGFYDLRLAETRQAQADLAREYGISGFCYYHYWFNGKRLLHQPFDEVLSSGEPDFPFCLCWANENWTRKWDGCDDQVLIGQNYCEEDDREHIRWLANAFRDRRYIRVEDKPMFLVYRASELPDPARTTSIWRQEAREMDIGELFLCRVESFPQDRGDPRQLGFDAAVEFQPDFASLDYSLARGAKGAFEYPLMVERMLRKSSPPYRRFGCVTPSWDNTPRIGEKATILKNASPEAYERWLRTILRKGAPNNDGESFVFVNAWNEWAEGNHLEPCQKWGRAYLEATRRALECADDAPITAPRRAVCKDAAGLHRLMVQAVHDDVTAIFRQVQAALVDADEELMEASAELERLERFNLALQDIDTSIPPGSTFILVDQEEWMCGEAVLGRRRIPFPERDGVYFGPPESDEMAICELQRLRGAGANYIVFGWPAFWWLEHYSGFNDHLRSHFRCVRNSNCVTIFELANTADMLHTRAVAVPDNIHAAPSPDK
jgi:hypothetical protein